MSSMEFDREIAAALGRVAEEAPQAEGPEAALWCITRTIPALLGDPAAALRPNEFREDPPPDPPGPPERPESPEPPGRPDAGRPPPAGVRGRGEPEGVLGDMNPLYPGRTGIPGPSPPTTPVAGPLACVPVPAPTPDRPAPPR